MRFVGGPGVSFPGGFGNLADRHFMVASEAARNSERRGGGPLGDLSSQNHVQNSKGDCSWLLMVGVAFI